MSWNLDGRLDVRSSGEGVLVEVIALLFDLVFLFKFYSCFDPPTTAISLF